MLARSSLYDLIVSGEQFRSILRNCRKAAIAGSMHPCPRSQVSPFPGCAWERAGAVLLRRLPGSQGRLKTCPTTLPRRAGRADRRFALRRLAVLTADFLAQHRGVIPREAQLGIAREAAQRLHQRRCALVVIQKDVPF